MSKIKTTLLLTLMGTGSLHAKNYMSFIGGGGEPKGPETIFDYQVKSMGKFHSDANWESQVSFNGGHSTTESLLSEGFGKKGVTNTPFTEDSYDRIIQDYETKINHNQITSGDQLMLVVSSHGAMKKTDKELTHDITLTGGVIQNFDTAEGSKTVSMDKLQNLVTLAESKGVKLAIIDLSCHSGNSLALNKKNTCIISATGPNHYSYVGISPNTFTNAFIDRMKKGKTLEDAFLEARASSTDLSFPMISSPVGLEVNDEMYDTITPYLYYYDLKHDKLSPYVTQEAAKGEACEEPKNYQELTTLISQFEAIKKAKGISYGSKDGRNFRESVDKYYATLTKLRTELKKLKELDNKAPVERFCTEINDIGFSSTSCWVFKLDEILTYKVEPMKALYKKKLETASAKEKKEIELDLEKIGKLEARQRQLLQENPDFAKRLEFFKSWPKLEEDSYNLANGVAAQAKEFYQAKYRHKSSTDTRHNPCKNFVL